MAYQNPPLAIITYRGVYSEWFYKYGKKSRILAKAKAAYIMQRGKKSRVYDPEY